MNTETSAGAVPAANPSRNAWLVGGVLAAASLAAGAGMLMRNAMPVPASQPVPPVAAPEAKAADKPVQRLAAAPKASPTPAAPACRDCGVVESVRQITRKGEASGIGAVAGGVLGAAVGNQMGKGNGRSAMTVLGAVGGGVAGHEIEKRAKSTTVHVVKVRMDDGSLRTIEQSAAARSGDRVIVEGNKLRPMPAGQG